MSMLNFCVNRGGANLSAARKRVLQMTNCEKPSIERIDSWEESNQQR
jgi:putative hemolysin